MPVRISLRLLVALCCIASLVACGGSSGGGKTGGGGGSKAVAEGSNDRWSPAVLKGVDVAKTGRIAVRALFGGTDKPLQMKIDMSGAQGCAAHAGAVFKQDKQINGDGTIPWVFCWVSAGLKGEFGTPDKGVALDQKGCVYEPHVIGLMKGQPLFIANSDQTSHNIMGKPTKNDAFNVSQAAGAAREGRVFSTAEMAIPLRCEVHAWMTCWVHVLEHPYFGVTGADGKVEIPNLPPGKYTLSFWHETWKAADIEVEVKEGAASAVEVKLQ